MFLKRYNSLQTFSFAVPESNETAARIKTFTVRPTCLHFNCAESRFTTLHQDSRLLDPKERHKTASSVKWQTFSLNAYQRQSNSEIRDESSWAYCTEQNLPWTLAHRSDEQDISCKGNRTFITAFTKARQWTLSWLTFQNPAHNILSKMF
jgi:hypothetical protein